MALTFGLIVLAWPRGSSGGRFERAQVQATPASRSDAGDAHLLRLLREARDQHQTEERAALAEHALERAAVALRRSRELEQAIAWLERLRRTSADPLDRERQALLCATRIQLRGASEPSERRVAAELCVRGLRAELERACAPGSGAEPLQEKSAADSDAAPAEAELRLELGSTAPRVLELELREASPEALLAALLEKLALPIAPPPATPSALRFEVRASALDAEELLRDAAGCLGWRLTGAFEENAGATLRWVPWTAAPSPEERLEMLTRIAESSLALETAPLDDLVRAEARFVRARALEELGESERALAEYALLAERSGSGTWAVEALRRSAEMHVQRGELDRALAAWERVAARDPAEPLRSLALLRSADLQLARGLRDAARERYELILRSSPGGDTERAARLGRLACRFERELAHATPQRLRLLASELAGEAEARRDPQLRARYLALSSALLRRVGATPLALRETLAACLEEPEPARRERIACEAAALALELRAPLAALWCLELAPITNAATNTELRDAAQALLGYRELADEKPEPPRSNASATRLAIARDPASAPAPAPLEQILARLRDRRATQEHSR